MRKIVVLGCGFAGYHAAQHLQRATTSRRKLQLAVVTDREHFVYTPLLPNVATGEIDPSHVTFSVRDAFAPTTEVIFDRVEHIDPQTRTLRTPSQTIDFDYLLIAAGAQTDWRGHPDWRSQALTCKSDRDAVDLRDHIATALSRASAADSPAERRRHLTFVVAGAGPTGTELAAELYSTLRFQVLDHAPQSLRDALRVVIVDPGPRLVPNLPTPLGRRATSYLRKLGVDLALNTSVSSFEDGVVVLSDGQSIETSTFCWCGGVRTPDLLRQDSFTLDSQGRLVVDPCLQVSGMRGIFAIGDAAGVAPDIPQTAQVATQQGKRAANNLLAVLDGRTPRPWNYLHKGDLLTLGRLNALAAIGGLVIEGPAAWTLYRIAYTALMPSGTNKAKLLKDWFASNLSPRSRSLGSEAWRRALDA